MICPLFHRSYFAGPMLLAAGLPAGRQPALSPRPQKARSSPDRKERRAADQAVALPEAADRFFPQSFPHGSRQTGRFPPRSRGSGRSGSGSRRGRTAAGRERQYKYQCHRNCQILFHEISSHSTCVMFVIPRCCWRTAKDHPVVGRLSIAQPFQFIKVFGRNDDNMQ